MQRVKIKEKYIGLSKAQRQADREGDSLQKIQPITLDYGVRLVYAMMLYPML